MKVYAVTEFHADYEQSNWELKAIFGNQLLAEDYCTKMGAVKGFPSESGPGSENEYEVIEMDIWEEPTVSHLLKFKSSGPQEFYRVEEFAPRGTVFCPKWGELVSSEEQE